MEMRRERRERRGGDEKRGGEREKENVYNSNI